jgi:hypothetical protein
MCTAPRAVAHGSTATFIASVKVGPDEQVHLVYGDGHEAIAPKERDQVDCASAKIAEDKRTAGWLVDFNNCCTSYPVPLVLIVYRDGKIVQRFDEGPIWDWQFLKSGKQVAFWAGPTHGAFTPHFELHDVRSGRLLAEWDGHVKDKHRHGFRG